MCYPLCELDLSPTCELGSDDLDEVWIFACGRLRQDRTIPARHGTYCVAVHQVGTLPNINLITIVIIIKIIITIMMCKLLYVLVQAFLSVELFFGVCLLSLICFKMMFLNVRLQYQEYNAVTYFTLKVRLHLDDRLSLKYHPLSGVFS